MSTTPALPVSDMPLWGQAWELTVTYATATGSEQVTLGSSAWEPESLRVTFDVLQAMNSSPIWYADISIYNLNLQNAQNTLLNATWATLKAGFQTGPNLSSIIWDGPVFQTLLTRENVVDQKLTLHCVNSPLYSLVGVTSFSMGAGSDQAQLLSTMAQQANLPDISTAQGTLGTVAAQRTKAVQYPRGNTVFGTVSKYLGQIADSAKVQSWTDGKQAYLSEVQNTATTPNLIYSPPFPPGYNQQVQDLPVGTTQSIIGTPQQIQQGAIFTVLLDPRLKVQLPPLLVQLVRTFVSLTQRTPDINSELPTQFSTNLTFLVQQVRHVGDTRGNEWHTEVTGYSTGYAQNLLNLFTP